MMIMLKKKNMSMRMGGSKANTYDVNYFKLLKLDFLILPYCGFCSLSTKFAG